MNIDTLENDIRKIVESLVDKIEIDELPKQKNNSSIQNNSTESNSNIEGMGLFTKVNDAVQAAKNAFKEYSQLSLEKRKDAIQGIREIVMRNNEKLSRMAQEETGLGCWKTKVIKNELASKKTPGVEDIVPNAFSDDHGMSLVERAPYGVIGSIIPCTNPTSTVTNNSISMLSGGNTVVFNPHPSAKKCSCETIKLINEELYRICGIKNLIVGITNPTIESAKEVMNNKDIAILVVTGGPAVVKTAMNSGKKVIAAGPGNPPTVVDESADLAKAGKDIVNGASFDNNIVCVCEKVIIALDSVKDRLKAEMKKNGAFELSSEQINKITEMVISKPGNINDEGMANKKYIGKLAKNIAKNAGIDVPDTTRLLLCDVNRDHPLVWTEQLMPVIPIVSVNNIDDAIDLAVKCEHGFRHTASMHSRNIENLSKMAKIMNCSIFVKNGPHYAGLGAGGAGFTSFTIASPTGEGLTRARTFTRERRCVLVDYFRII